MSTSVSPSPVSDPDRADVTEGESGRTPISERESREIEAANASGTTPVVFIHGLWLLPSSWSNWADVFAHEGYAPLTPDWPDDPITVESARAEPEILSIWQEVMATPCVAIGGITTDNAAGLAAAGADFLAVSAGVWRHAQGPAAAVRALNAAIAEGLAQRP